MSYVIVATGPAATPGLDRVINPWTNEVRVFETRAEARAHRAEILPMQPSKYLPLVIREVA